MGSNVTVTPGQVERIISNSNIVVETVLGKCTVVTAELPNGFIIVEHSACVDPANYNEKIGKEICLERIRNKIWELEGYKLQSQVSAGLSARVDVSVKDIEVLKDTTEILTGFAVVTSYLISNADKQFIDIVPELVSNERLKKILQEIITKLGAKKQESLLGEFPKQTTQEKNIMLFCKG
ncbi:TPA: hypothetical protein QCY19_003996 [Bacillus luti]|nr:hypothetical protein [Bacillus luti]